MLARTLKTGTAVIAMVAAAPLLAQGTNPPPVAAEGGVSDIVVTAQRRAERIQDVPIAISAFSADQLAAQGVSNTLQLGQYVPNLIAQNNTGLGSANAYYLRGLGNTETIATFDPPVGTYVDDIYISRQNANNLSLFDVERVEVLRGPQGTLFGRNTTGGAVSVIMRKPEFDRIGGYAEVGYGSYQKKLARASIDLPLAPTFAIKVSGYYQDDNGYAKNVTTGQRTNDDDGWGVRLGIRGELAPWARWNASYAHIAADGENLLNFVCNPAAPTQCNGRFVTLGIPNGRNFAAGTGPFSGVPVAGRKRDYGLGNRAASDLITSTLEFDLNSRTTLALITGFVGLTQQYALDFADGRGLPNLAAPRPVIRGFRTGGFAILNDGRTDQFTQEAKLAGSIGDRFYYVGGLYYYNERNKTDFADVFTIFTGNPAGLPLLLGDRVLRNTTNAIAGYFQGDVKFGGLTLTAGIRYTDETKRFDINDNRAACYAPGAPGNCLVNANLIAPSGVRIPTSQTARLWTPRFAVNYKATPDILLFASATRGFKSGGWNARGTSPGQLLPFDPEKVWSYEAGFKSEFFDRRVRLNVTGFYMDVTDLQTPSALVAPNGSITFITRNFANYRNKGIEAELTIAPVTGLNLFANVGYQDDKYIVPGNQPATDIYGIQGFAGQAAACRAQLAAGQVPGTPNTSPTGVAANNAPACGAGIVDARGNLSTPVRTPDFTISLGGSYRIPLGEYGLTPSVNASYRGRQEVGTNNLSFYTGAITAVNGTFAANPYAGDFITGSLSPPAWLVNAGVTLSGPDNRFSLSADCTNCFDKAYVQSSLVNYSYLNPPVQFMVRARVKY